MFNWFSRSGLLLSPITLDRHSYFQFIFLSVGWLLTGEIWRFFNPETSTDPNLEGLANFILTDQIALGGAGIGIGYVSYSIKKQEECFNVFYQGIASSLYWLGLSQLGNPISSRKKSLSVDGRIGIFPSSSASEDDANKRVSFIDDVLPNMLTRNGVLQQILINGVLVSQY